MNWSDGMMIDQSHLMQNNSMISNQIRDVAGSYLTPNNYGILHNSRYTENPAFDIDNSYGHIEVSLLKCSAVTGYGTRVEINPKLMQAIAYPQEELVIKIENNERLENSTHFLLFLIVPADQLIPVGKPYLDEENMERIPYLSPHLQLDYEKIDPGSNSWYGKFEEKFDRLPLALLTIDNLGVRLNKKYIPPVSMMTANHDAIGIIDSLNASIRSIRSNALPIIRKLQDADRSIRDQDLTYLNFKALLVSILPQILSLQAKMEYSFQYRSPALLAEEIKSLAWHIDAYLRALHPKEFRELLNGCKERDPSARTLFEEDIPDTLEMKYNHLDAYYSAFKSCTSLLDNFNKLLKTVSERGWGITYMGSREYDKERQQGNMDRLDENRSNSTSPLEDSMDEDLRKLYQG